MVSLARKIDPIRKKSGVPILDLEHSPKYQVERPSMPSEAYINALQACFALFPSHFLAMSWATSFLSNLVRNQNFSNNLKHNYRRSDRHLEASRLSICVPPRTYVRCVSPLASAFFGGDHPSGDLSFSGGTFVINGITRWSSFRPKRHCDHSNGKLLQRYDLSSKQHRGEPAVQWASFTKKTNPSWSSSPMLRCKTAGY